MDHFLKKGDRVHAQWFQATDACLAGMQPKTGAILRDVTGIVRHIRGDHPTNPTEIRVWVEPDEGGDEVIVNPKHIVAVL
jgi:hypothetical protein